MKTILIIEDDPAILKGLEAALQLENYRTLSATNGDQGYQMAKHDGPDLIILDLMLPGRSGEQVCRELRAEGFDIPVIMLTAKTDEIDRVMGLEIGADDYVTKPFSQRELLARVRAILRRNGAIARELDEYRFGDLHVDVRRQEARRGGELLRLTALEFRILLYFVRHEGEVITRDRLLDDVWGHEAFPTTRTVDNFILSLRKKIEADPANPVHLITLHRSGYKFVL